MEQRHAKEFRKAIGDNQYEVSPEGIFLPAAKVCISGLYSCRVRPRGIDIGNPWEEFPNLLPTLGINFLFDALDTTVSGAPLFLSLYAGAISPAAGWTAASYPGTATEITSGSEGYSESARVAWTSAVAASANKDNYASPAVFTIVTATSLTVNGVGMHTVATKGGTTGVLVSATRFGGAKSFGNTDEFDMKYRLSATST